MSSALEIVMLRLAAPAEGRLMTYIDRLCRQHDIRVDLTNFSAEFHTYMNRLVVLNTPQPFYDITRFKKVRVGSTTELLQTARKLLRLSETPWLGFESTESEFEAHS